MVLHETLMTLKGALEAGTVTLVTQHPHSNVDARRGGFYVTQQTFPASFYSEAAGGSRESPQESV